MESIGPGQAQQWLKIAGDYGISFVFTFFALGMLLWVTVVCVSLLKKWVPLWFQWSIRSHQKTCDYLESATATLDCLHDKVHDIANGGAAALKAQHSFATKTKSKYDIPSDVVAHLETAKGYFDNAASHVRHRHPIKPTKDGEKPPGGTERVIQ